MKKVLSKKFKGLELSLGKKQREFFLFSLSNHYSSRLCSSDFPDSIWYLCTEDDEERKGFTVLPIPSLELFLQLPLVTFHLFARIHYTNFKMGNWLQELGALQAVDISFLSFFFLIGG